MKVLALFHLTLGRSEDELKPKFLEDIQRLWQLYGSGALREIHLLADRPGAVIEFEVADLEDARAAVDSVPTVRAGLLTAELLPLKPFFGLRAVARGQTVAAPQEEHR